MNDRSSENDRKNHRRQILSEEEYSSTLQKIITRDYFPSLTSLNRDASILQKRFEGDIAGAVAIRRAAREIAQHEALEQSIEREEEREALGRGNVRKRPRPLKEESVDGFHMRVTSEDNADFEETMKLEVQAKEQEMDLVYNYHHHHHHQNASSQRLRLEHGNTEWNRLSHDEQQKHTNSRLNPSPLLASDEFMPSSTSRTCNGVCTTIQTLDTSQTAQTIEAFKTTNPRMMGGASFRNALFFTPNSLQQDTTSAHTSNTSIWNPSMLTNHHETNNNTKNIMPPPVFDPKSGESSLPSQLIPYEYKAKPTESSKEKRIIPSNTRFLYQNESRLITCMDHNQPSLEDEYRRVPPNSNMTLRQRSSLDVLNYDTESSNATTDLDDISISSNTIQREREARRHKLEEERNSYVNMTPIILPGQGRDTSPLMTFGNIASTPLVSSLSHSHDSYNTFFIPNEDSKEKMAQTAQLQLKQKSERFQSTSGSSTNSRLSTSTPRMDRRKSLTPAAQVLLQRFTTPSSSSSVSLLREKNSHSRPTSSTSSLSTSSSARMSSAFASALRHSYTPTHTKKKDRHNTNKDPKNKTLMHVYKATPMNDTMREKDVGKSSISNTNTTNTVIKETTRGLLKL